MPVRFHEGRCAVKSIPVIPALIPVFTMQSQPGLTHLQCPLQGMGLIYCVLISNAGPVPGFISLESLDRQSSASRELSKGRAHQRPARAAAGEGQDAQGGRGGWALTAIQGEHSSSFQQEWWSMAEFSRATRSSPVMSTLDGKPSPELQHTNPGRSPAMDVLNSPSPWESPPLTKKVWNEIIISQMMVLPPFCCSLTLVQWHCWSAKSSTLGTAQEQLFALAEERERKN